VNFKNSAEKAFTDSGLKNANDGEQRSIDFSESVKKSEEVYQQILKENGAGGNRALIHEYNKDSIKHLEKVFDEIASRARLLKQFAEDINKILKYLKDKPDCAN
jgi:hypothetical protein